MPLLNRQDFGDCLIALWKVDEDEDTLLLLISNRNEYMEELNKFKSVSRRKEWLAVRALLDSVARGEKIEYKPSGSPYLKSGNYNISISHTSSYVSVILSKEKKVAIDIEKYGNRVEKVVSRFVRDDEHITPFKGDNIWSMLLHWSSKETAYKMIDHEETDFKKHFFITPFVTDVQGEFLLKESVSPKQETLLIYYRIFDDFVMTWSVR